MKKIMWAFSAVGLFLLLMVVAGCGDNNNNPTVVPAAADRSPDAFTFVDQTGVALSTVVTSAPAPTITVTGINRATPISITGTIGSNSEFSVNGGTFTAAADVTVVKDDTVTVRHTASAISSTPTVTTLTIGDVVATFTSTTAPFAFAFVDQTGTDIDPLVVTSDTVTIAGLAAPADISVSVGGEYSIDNGVTWNPLPGIGTVTNDAKVSVRHTAAATENTATITTLTIGTTPGTFTSTTVSLAAGTAAYDAKCGSCHALGAYDITFTVVAGVDTPDLDGFTNTTILLPVQFPTPGVAGHNGITLSAAEIFALSFLFDHLNLLPAP